MDFFKNPWRNGGSSLIPEAIKESKTNEIPEIPFTPEVLCFGMASNFYALLVPGAFGGMAKLGASVVIFQTKVFRTWLGWTGIFTGMALVISTAGLLKGNPAGIFAAVGGIALLVYFLWLAALSVEMLRFNRPSKLPSHSSI